MQFDQDGYNDDLSAMLFEEAGVEVVCIEPQPDLEPTIPFDMNPNNGEAGVRTMKSLDGERCSAAATGLGVRVRELETLAVQPI